MEGAGGASGDCDWRGGPELNCRAKAPGDRCSRSRRGTITTGLVIAALLLPARLSRADVAPPPVGRMAESIIQGRPSLVLYLAYALVLVLVARLLLAALRGLARRRGGETHEVATPAFGTGKKYGGYAWKIWLAVACVVLVIAAVAIPNFLEFRKSAREQWKTRYPARLLREIGSTEVAYFAEWNVFVANQPPVTPPLSPSREGWFSQTRFSLIGYGFFDESSVLTPDFNCSFSLEGPDFPTAAQGFLARAVCDQDHDDKPEIYTITDSSDVTASGDAPW